LVHEVRLAIDREQQPAQIVQFQRRQKVGLGFNCRLDVLRVFMKNGFASGNNLGQDREAVARRCLGIDRAVLTLVQVIGPGGWLWLAV
jgi:hypothetical protein